MSFYGPRHFFGGGPHSSDVASGGGCGRVAVWSTNGGRGFTGTRAVSFGEGALKFVAGGLGAEAIGVAPAGR